jgi:predicted ATPase
MTLTLQNIGMIEKASVKIDGLTVIAGENDTGKSTVGKALFLILKGLSKQTPHKFVELDHKLLFKLFKSDILGKEHAQVILHTQNSTFEILQHKHSLVGSGGHGALNCEELPDIIFIESPLVWNLQDLFNTSIQVESQLKMIGEEIDIPYPYLLKDLYFKLHTKKVREEDQSEKEKFDRILQQIAEVINGDFQKSDQTDHYYFKRKSDKFDLINVATGIKYFGILQVLLNNNRLNEKTIVVLDEPEVHLHPKWQLKMAEIIVMLVKKGVKIVVNSHSPYMIEALQRYSELKGIENKTNFYLAEDGKIDKVEKSNALTLEKIFEKLAEPFDVFDKMDGKVLSGE